MSRDGIQTDVYFAQVPEWVIFHEDLSHAAVRVYAAIHRKANSEGRAFPSYAWLGRKCNCSPDTAKRAIRQLEQAGALTSEPRFEDGRQTSNLYTLYFTPPSMRAGGEGGTSAGGEGGTSAQADTESVDTEPTPLSAGADQEAEDEPTYHLSHTEAFEALADACGYDAEAIRKVGGGLIGRNAKLLREAGATREEILARADRYRHKHPDWDLTPAALVKWWPTLEPPEGSEDRTCECGQSTGRSHDPRAHDLLLS